MDKYIWLKLLEAFDADHPEARNLVNRDLNRYIDSCDITDKSAQKLKHYRDTGMYPGATVDGSLGKNRLLPSGNSSDSFRDVQEYIVL
jgi:hypothetical protein